MLTVSSLKHYLQQASSVSASLAQQADTIPTLAIQWDKADELVWTLRLTEFFGDASGGWGYQPDVSWDGETPGILAYADSPLSADDSVAGTCSCRVSVQGDALVFGLAVRAWRVEGNQQQFIQLKSPDAALLGWSHWPCTDMGVYFGTLEPGQSSRISGRLEFSEREFEPI